MTPEKLLAQIDRRMKLYNKIVLKTLLKELKKSQIQNQKLMEANKILLNAIKSKTVINETTTRPTYNQPKRSNSPIQRMPGPNLSPFNQPQEQEFFDDAPMSMRDEYLNNSLKDQVGEDEVMALLQRK